MNESVQTRSATFSTAQILSVATGVLVCPIEEVYDILNWMTGDNLFTHQLPRAARWAAPILRLQMPWLNAVHADSVGPQNWQLWLAECVRLYRAKHVVTMLESSEWEHRNPIVEAAEMMGHADADGGKAC